MGLEQAVKAVPSKLQSKPVTPTLSVPVKLIVRALELVEPPFTTEALLPSMAEVMVVSGGVVSGGGGKENA